MTNKNYIFSLYPISDYSLPDYYNPSFDHWQREAMNILASRSESDIAKILLDIDTHAANEMLGKYDGFSALEQMIQNLSRENIDKLYEWDLYPGRLQFISLLHLKLKGKGPESVSSVPNLEWVECFACVLLGKIKFALDRETKIKELGFNNSPYSSFCDDAGEYMGLFALNCMEIETFLASLPGRTWNFQTKDLNRERSRKANDTKYASSRDAKNRFFEWFDQERNSFSSNIDAIMEYMANQIPSDDKRVITSSRMLEDALRERKRR